MLDATLREANIWGSVKKFFVDNMQGSPGYPVYFDRVIVGPRFDQSQWINVTVDNVIPAYVSHALMTVYMCSKHDNEGDEISNMRDLVLESLFPGYIDLYDTSQDPWVKVNAMKVSINEQSDTIYNPDRSKMIYIICILKWGAVWSK